MPLNNPKLLSKLLNLSEPQVLICKMGVNRIDLILFLSIRGYKLANMVVFGP